MTELKRCPFCGGAGVFELSPNGNGKVIVRCSTCFCALVHDFSSESEAAMIWNSRKRSKS